MPMTNEPTMTWTEALAMLAAVLQTGVGDTPALRHTLPGGQILAIDIDPANSDIGILTVRDLPLSLDSVAELSVMLSETMDIDTASPLACESDDLALALRAATAERGTVERGRVTIEALPLHVNTLATVLALVQADVHRQEVRL